ncbi:hypothetical protein BaRGS_00020327 [Batillaria attramentaria]|uniref:G-protein coupled receptors family 1 profile domain-containing protein n=1 Tax=Batillaria attramentaria TaxID=370345 RepID=A0ABD0KN83_9CAEN
MTDECMVVEAGSFNPSDNPQNLVSPQGVYRELVGPAFFFISNFVGFTGFVWVSMFLSAVIASERCFCVVSPFKAKEVLKTSTMAVIIIVVSAVLLGGMLAIAGHKHTSACVFDPATNTTSEIVYVTEYYLKNKEILDIFDVWFYSTAFPIFFLLVIAITTAVTAARLRTVTTTQDAKPAHSKREISLTKMLIATSVLFIVCLVPNVMVQIHTWITYATSYTDVWLVVAMMLERAVSVVMPHKPRVLTHRGTGFIMAGITLFCFAICAHILFGVNVDVNSNGVFACTFVTEDYKLFFRGAWAWFDLFAFALIPVIVLIISRAVIIWKVKASARMVSWGSPHLKHKRMISFLSASLLLLSLVYLLTSLPIDVMNVMELSLIELAPDPKKEAMTNLAWAMTSIMAYSRNASNFFLYYISGSAFRRDIKTVLKCRAESYTPTNTTFRHG